MMVIPIFSAATRRRFQSFLRLTGCQCARRAGGLYLILAASGSSGALASDPDDGWQEMAVRIARTQHYFVEQCVMLPKGDVDYRFESPHPLAFNVHYHVGPETAYKVEQAAVTKVDDDFVSEAEQSYCFMWTSKHRRDEGWQFTLYYRVSPSS